MILGGGGVVQEGAEENWSNKGETESRGGDEQEGALGETGDSWS